MRSRTREIATALGVQAKAAATVAGDVATVAREISAVRAANAEQAETVAALARRDTNDKASTVPAVEPKQ
jgi:hypothetical protein